MDALQKLLAKLTLRQRLSIGGAAAIVAAGLFLFVRWNAERNFQPLFSSLSAEDAGHITTRLRERGIEFRLAESGNRVLVPSERVAELRLDLAGEGIPKSGRIGFELFDKTNLATTDFQEQVNYHRALEGELERSIMSIAEVEQARVHVTFAKDSVFVESRRPAKASVMLKLRAGARLAPQSVSAITHLAASAVEGLQPEAVSVLDTRGTVLNRPKRTLLPDGTEPDDAQIDYRQKVERDLLAKVNATLEPLLGGEHFRAGVTTEVDFSSGEQSEESFDPTRSVMASQQRTEDQSGTVASVAGVPGTASNLPRPPSRPGESGKNVSRRTENITYQSTRTVKHVRLPQGSLKRISLSILVDHGLRWEGTGSKAKKIVEPPSAEKLKKIADLVSAAAGLQTQRGDQMIVESVPFESTLSALPPDASGGEGVGHVEIAWPPWIPLPLRNAAILGGIGVGLLLCVGFGIVLLKKMWKRPVPITAVPTTPLPLAGAAQSAGEQMVHHANQTKEMEAEAVKLLQVPEGGIRKGEVLAKHIAEQAKKDPAGAAHLIRHWLHDDALAR